MYSAPRRRPAPAALALVLPLGLTLVALAPALVPTTPAFAHVAATVGRPAPAAEEAPEPPIAAAGPGGSYLRLLHARVHPRWTDNFLRLSRSKLPPGNPLNDPTRSVQLRVLIGADGQIISVQVRRSSGWRGFDDAAVEVVRDSAPLPPPPDGLRSDDGYLHVAWLFARDARRDAVLAIEKNEEPLDRGLPRLMRADRRPEAVERVRAARASGRTAEPMMTLMAVEWMKGALASPYARVEIAAALAARPEPATRQPALRWLELAVRQPDRAEAAGPALTAAGGKVCPLVKTDLAADDVSTRARAALALRDAGEADCRAGLLALARSPKAAAQARARAVAALAAYGDPESRAVVTAALAGGDATLRTGALSGLGRSRAGSARAPSLGAALRDPTAEVRAAAAAAAVRIGGGEALAALPIILQDPDPRPARAAAEEMAGLPGEDPSGVLVRLLERPEPEVREAAAHALVTRGEQTAYGALRPLLADGSPPRLRALALVAAEGPTLTQLARDSRLARAVYRAYLARGERDQAADCLLSHINVLPRPDQDALMLEWLGARPRPAPAGTAEPEPEPTAAR